MISLTLLVHEAVAGALFYTCFCRAIHMNAEHTRYGVLFAFWMLGLASVVMIAAPIVWGWEPSIPTIVLMLAIIIVQLVTSHFWHAGVPPQFRVPHEN